MEKNYEDFDFSLKCFFRLSVDIIKKYSDIKILSNYDMTIHKQFSLYVEEYKKTLPSERGDFHLELFDIIYQNNINDLIKSLISSNIKLILGSNFGTDTGVYFPLSDIYKYATEIHIYYENLKNKNPNLYTDSDELKYTSYYIYFLFQIFEETDKFKKNNDSFEDIFKQLEDDLGIETKNKAEGITSMFGDSSTLKNILDQIPQQLEQIQENLPEDIKSSVPKVKGENIANAMNTLLNNENLGNLINQAKDNLMSAQKEDGTYNLGQVIGPLIKSFANTNMINTFQTAIGQLGLPMDPNLSSSPSSFPSSFPLSTPSPSLTIQPPYQQINIDDDEDDEIPFV